MPETTFRAVLIGAGGFGGNILEAICRSDRISLAGLGDRDAAAAEAAAERAACPAYTDHRRLIVETRPDGVFLAVPPAPAAELARLAAQHGAHVWTAAPMARRLADAVEICRAVHATGRKLAVGTQRRFAGGYRRARRAIRRLGDVHLLQASYLFDYGPRLGWRGDRAAGGGVLAELGSHIFDLTTWLLGPAESVFAIAASGHQAPARAAEPVYDTDDTAVALLGYAGRTAAAVTLSRCFSPVREELIVYGREGSLSAGADHCTLRDRDGTVVESFRDDQPPAVAVARQIDAFVAAAAADAATYECSGWEHLLTMATIEAARLSDRTGQPESPAGMLANYDLTTRDCTRFVPDEESEGI